MDQLLPYKHSRPTRVKTSATTWRHVTANLCILPVRHEVDHRTHFCQAKVMAKCMTWRNVRVQSDRHVAPQISLSYLHWLLDRRCVAAHQE
jgi:hypothetical protein